MDGFGGRRYLRQNLIVELAARYRSPSILANDTFPKDGGLMYYGDRPASTRSRHIRSLLLGCSQAFF
jgi:hypothetical protein